MSKRISFVSLGESSSETKVMSDNYNGIKMFGSLVRP